MKPLIIPSLCVLLAACAGSPDSHEQADNHLDELAAYSVVAVTDPAFEPSRGDRISWVSDVIFVGNPNQEAPVALEQQIRTDINQQITAKGYTLAQGSDVHYRVVALVQTGSEQLSEEMRELFRLYPSLGNASHTEQGMLIVALARPGSTQALWRGGIKVFLDQDRQLTSEQRKQRLQLAVAKVMASMPKAL